jgi:hypothetical protein
MNIEIHQPDIEVLIKQHMASGAFRDIDELLAKALGSLKEPGTLVAPSVQSKSLVDLFEPVRGLLTDDEVDTLFSRNPSLSRTVDLS